jgi:hypothetical protein
VELGEVVSHQAVEETKLSHQILESEVVAQSEEVEVEVHLMLRALLLEHHLLHLEKVLLDPYLKEMVR